MEDDLIVGVVAVVADDCEEPLNVLCTKYFIFILVEEFDMYCFLGHRKLQKVITKPV